MHAPPPLSMRDLTRGKAKAPRAPSVAFRIVQGSVLPFRRCPVRLLQRPRTQEQRAPCLRRTCCLAWGLSSLSFSSECASNGQRVEEAWLPRGTAMSLLLSQNVGLFRSPINMAIDSSRPLASLPPIGRHAERTPLSLSRVCMFVCGYVRVAHRETQRPVPLYAFAEKRTLRCVSQGLLVCPRLSCLASKQAS